MVNHVESDPVFLHVNILDSTGIKRENRYTTLAAGTTGCRAPFGFMDCGRLTERALPACPVQEGLRGGAYG